MPTIRNSRLVYSTDPDVEVGSRRVRPRKPKQGRSRPVIPTDGVIRVFVERKGRRGKAVTVLRGVPGDAVAQKTLLKQLKAKLGTGGTCKDGVIEIQGDHRDRVIELLTAQGHISKKAGG